MVTPQKIIQLFEKAKEDVEHLAEIEHKARRDKKSVIRKLAEDLEKQGMAPHTICQEIVQELRSVVYATFVRRCLDDKYKDPKQSSNAKQQKGRRRERYVHDSNSGSLATLVSPDIKEEKEASPIIIDNRGQPSPVTPPSDRWTNDSRTESSNMIAPDHATDDSAIKHKENQDLKMFFIPKTKLKEMIGRLGEVDDHYIAYVNSNNELVRFEPDHPARRSSPIKRPSSRNHYKDPLKTMDLLLKIGKQVKTSF